MDNIKDLIDKNFTADIGLNKAWVTYSDGNDGEEDYYRDVYTNGILAYCYGESCLVVGCDHERRVVFLTNPEEQIFEISYEQFKEDFVECYE